MIARLWHGLTLAEHTDDYLACLRSRAVPDYRATPGNLSVEILHRTAGALTHYLIVTHCFLLEFEPTVQHHTVEPRRC